MVSREEIVRKIQAAKAAQQVASFANEDFKDCDLSGVDFSDSVVTGASFQGANLQGANLSQVTGLGCEQLGGANLAGCRLPETVAEFHSVDVLNECIKYATSLLLATMGASIYFLLTVFATHDLQLLTQRGSATLPVLNLAVGTRTFFQVGPLVIGALATVFFLVLGNLWSHFLTLPLVFPDGVPIERRVQPWLVNQLLNLRSKNLAAVDCARLGFVMLVAYGVAFLTLFVCYARICAVVKYDPNIVYPIVGLTLLVGGVSFAFLRAHWQLLRKGAGKGLKSPVTGGAIFLVAVAILFLADIVYLIRDRVPSQLSSAQLGFRRGVSGRIGPLAQWMDPTGVEQVRQIANELQQPGGFSLRPGFLPDNVNIEGDLSLRPEGWKSDPNIFVPPSAKENSESNASTVETLRAERQSKVRQAIQDLNALIPPASLIGSAEKIEALSEEAAKVPTPRTDPVLPPGLATNLSFIRASNAFLVNADIRGVNLYGADLNGANLRSARFSEVSAETDEVLFSANLNCTLLRSADLSSARAEGVNLVLADLRDADLSFARMSKATAIGANFKNAVLTWTSLDRAVLIGSNLSYATMPHVVLVRAQLRGANLKDTILIDAQMSGAKMSYAKLDRALLINANLSQANLSGATCSATDFEGAQLYEAGLEGVDFLSALNVKAAKFNGAYGNEKTKLPKGLPYKKQKLSAGEKLVHPSATYKLILNS